MTQTTRTTRTTQTATRKTGSLPWKSFALGIAAGGVATLGNYVRHEIRRRGYPSWESCYCDFKSNSSVFQVLHSHHEQRGETIFAEEWGILLPNLPEWTRRFLHSTAQVMAVLNLTGHYVERVELSPQEARQLATLLHGSTNEGEAPPANTHIIWRREVLHPPRNLFDKCIRRLYPVYITQERSATIDPLPAVWDPDSDLPLPTEGELLETPIGTRIDCIGWTPSQISYCTAHIAETEETL